MLGHDRLDVAVSNPGANGDAAPLGDHLRHRLRDDQIVNDRRTGVFAQHGGGDDRRRCRTRQTLALLVDQKHAVGIAVEGQAHISTHLEHPGPEVGLILGLQRVGGVVGEAAVELAVHHLQLRVEALERCGHDQATHAVGNVGDHREGAEAVDVDEAAHVVNKLLEHVGGRHQTGLAHGLEVGASVVANPIEAAVEPQGTRPGATELDAVVSRRIVRRREHGRRCVHRPAGEVHLVGGTQAEVDDIEALAGHPASERCDEAGSARAHVAPDEDPRRGHLALGPADEKPGVRSADPLDQRLIELVGNQASHVVGLKDAVQVCHGRQH